MFKVDSVYIIKFCGSYLEKYLFRSELNKSVEDYEGYYKDIKLWRGKGEMFKIDLVECLVLEIYKE